GKSFKCFVPNCNDTARHFLNRFGPSGCVAFQKMKAVERAEFVEKENLCIFCLDKRCNNDADCFARKKGMVCYTCQEEHHSLLHGTVVRGQTLMVSLKVRSLPPADADGSGVVLMQLQN
ncbi:hypothetical protein DC007_14675, partial [Enterococcus faecalis]